MRSCCTAVASSSVTNPFFPTLEGIVLYYIGMYIQVHSASSSAHVLGNSSLSGLLASLCRSEECCWLLFDQVAIS